MSLFTPAQIAALKPLCLCGGAIHPVDSIVIHHTGDPACTLAGIHRDHLTRGYGGIGYHVLIAADGMVQLGRPIWARGAHCRSNNAGRIGIAFNADCSIRPPSRAQLGSAMYLIQSIMRIYGTLMVLPHYAVPGSSTDCPGRPCVEALADLGVVWHTK